MNRVHSACGSIPVGDGAIAGAQAARSFAFVAHGDQQYGDRPYIHHLDAVADVVASWGFRGAMLDAAYLHDVIEDTSITRAEIASVFGQRVADMVWAVTAGDGVRDERMASIYAKVAKDGAAAIVKVADRIANLEAAEPGSQHAARYLREDDAFTAALRPCVPAFVWLRYVLAILSAKAAGAKLDGYEAEGEVNKNPKAQEG